MQRFFQCDINVFFPGILRYIRLLTDKCQISDHRSERCLQIMCHIHDHIVFALICFFGRLRICIILQTHLIHLPLQLGKLLRKFDQLIFIGIHFWNRHLYLFHAIRDFGEHAQRIGNGNQKHAHKRDRGNMCLHPLKDQIPRILRIPHDLTAEKCTDDIPYRKDTDAQKHMKKISSSPLAQQFCFVHPLLLQFISNAPDGLDKLRFSAVFMHFFPYPADMHKHRIVAVIILFFPDTFEQFFGSDRLIQVLTKITQNFKFDWCKFQIFAI